MPRYLDCQACGAKAVSFRDKPDAKIKRLESEVSCLEGRIREIETFLDEHHEHPTAATALHDFMAGDCRHIFTIEDDAPGTRCCRLCGHPVAC